VQRHAGEAAAAPLREGVLVELYTSEGCSSCPPADAWLRSLAADRDAGAIPLALHVDYWDHLGWRDPWASPVFTARQHEHRAVAGAPYVYTPQLLVAGRDERVRGEAALRTALARARADQAASPVTPRITRLDVDPRRDVADVEVEVRWPARAAEGRVFVAITQDDLVSEVRRGENGGRRLAHAGVARALELACAAPSTRCRVTLPLPTVGPGAEHVVAFIDDPRDRAVRHAVQAVLRR
jgi:hypothetical protein